MSEDRDVIERYAAQEGIANQRFRFPRPRWIATLLLIACLAASCYVVTGHDLEQIYERVSVARGEGYVALELDDTTRGLFVPSAIERYQHCSRVLGDRCFITLQDIRTRPELMRDPQDRVNDSCRALPGGGPRHGLHLQFEFKVVEGSKPQQTTCVLTNKAEADAFLVFEFGALLKALLLDVLGLLAFLLL